MAKVQKRVFDDEGKVVKKKKKVTEKKVKGIDFKSKLKPKLKTINFGAKYRPNTVEEFVGQEHLIKQYRGWVKTKTFPSTLLIVGKYGAGKTTFGLLIAKAVNCETFNACGECASCKLFDGGGKHPDLLEFDMSGDDGKVKGSQAIVDSSRLSPLFNRRVYLFDECHLMSSEAESKFLVVGEEPPPNTMFIFVTTDPQKMKQTLVSRCVRLPINPIEPEVIAERLAVVAKREKILPTDKKELKEAKKALQVMADFSDGSMRNGLGLLQSVYSAVVGGESFTGDLVETFAQADPDVNVSDKAVQLVAAYMKMDLTDVVCTMRQGTEPRALMHKCRWLLYYLIGHIVKSNKFQTAELRKFLEVAKKEKIALNPVSAIYLQKTLCEVEVAFNSTSIPPDVMFESSVTALMTDLYSGKLSVEYKK